MTDLKEKIAIVTGASRGIGRAIAERLGREGATVVVNYARSSAAAREVVSVIEAGGGKAVAIQADVSDVAAVRNLFGETIDRFGQLDILINSAGTAVHMPLTDTTEDAFDSLFALNARGTFFAMQEAARCMNDGGRIVNISSVNTVLPYPAAAAYLGSKAAVEQFAAVASKELGERGITVNSVSPGATETELLDRTNTPESKAFMARLSPLGRLGRPQDIADLVAFVVSEDARWVTGQNIKAAGGVA